MSFQALNKKSTSKKSARKLKTKKMTHVSSSSKSLYVSSVFGIGLLGVIGGAIDANAAVTRYETDSTNSVLGDVSLSAPQLGNGALSNPSALTTGATNYKYVAVTFTAKEDHQGLTLGQLSAPTDTVMILYEGIFDAQAPGAGAIVGNDDTRSEVHSQTLADNGYNYTGTIYCGADHWCPQIKSDIKKGQTYTLLVSVYNPNRSDQLGTSVGFYATGEVVFGQYTGRSPIDMSKNYHLGSALYDAASDTGEVDPIFVGGTLQVDQTAASYSHNFTLSDMATNTIDANGNHAVFTGVLANEGTTHGVITISDKTNTGGSVTFTGNNTYTGSTTLGAGGTLLVSQDSNLGASPAKLVFDGGTLKTTSTFDSSRDIFIASSGGSINIAASTTMTHDGSISGTGNWNKEGSGALILNGNSTSTGSINVNAGSLIVGSDNVLGSTAQIGGNVNVGNTGTLAGHGTILGHVTANTGGKVAPGSSLGVLSVGDLTFNGGSIYELDAYSDGTSDAINATGAATINSNAHLSVLAGAGTWNESTTYTIIDAAGGVTGTFDKLTTNMAFLTPSLNIVGNELLLTLARNSTAVSDVGQTDNQRNSGKGLGGLGAGNSVYDTIISMDARSANQAFDNLSGEIHASAKSAALANSDYTRIAINRHLEGNNFDLSNQLPNFDRNLWVHTWGYDGHLKSDYNAEKLKNKGYGILLGFDAYEDGSTVLGLAAGYEKNDLHIGGTRSSKADVNAIHVLAYGRTSVGEVDIKGGFGYSQLDIKTNRNIHVGSILSENKADYDGSLAQVFVEGSQTFEAGKNFNVTPYAGLTYQYIRTDSFSETVDNAAGQASVLHHNSSSDNSVTSSIGVRGEMNVSQSSSLYADLAWLHTFGNTSPESKLHFTGGEEFTIYGAKIDRNTAAIGFGANIELKSNVRLSAGYEGRFGDESRSHGGSVRLEFAF